MGQHLSVDFRQSLTRLCARPITTDAKSDAEVWRPLFSTTLTSEEIGMYVTPLDVRMMRRSLPSNLALLIYRCMEQAAAFIEDAEAAYSGLPGAPEPRVIDDTAVLNAVRILAAVLPTAYEDYVLDPPPPQPPKAATYPNPPLPVSSQAADFHTRFFWHNDAHTAVPSAFPPLLATSRASGALVPLGQELIELLTRLCFVTRWTMDKAVPMQRQPLDLTTADRAGHGVVAEYLLVPGLFRDHVVDGALFFARELKMRRYECIRALIAAVAVPVAVGQSLAPNPFLDVLVDARRNPLGATLCCSLVNYVSQYATRGIAPFTSHFWAELPEAFLADALQLLAIVLSGPHDGVASGAAGEVDWYVRGRNHWWHFVHGLSLNTTTANFIAVGLFRVIENPLFAATTVLSGSQRRLKCCPEALQFTARLVTAPHATGFLQAFAAISDALLFPLLFFLQLAKADRDVFADAQCVLYILMKLSTTKEFRAVMGNTFEGVMPFAELPAPQPGATFGDVLTLVLCDVIGPAAPKWVWPLSNSAAVILSNVSHDLRLQEGQCFELFHALDYVTSTAYPRGRFVDRSALVVAITDTVITVCEGPHRVDAAPLVAALATVDIPARLHAMCDPSAPLAAAASDAGTTLHVELKAPAVPHERFLLPPAAVEQLQLAAIGSLSAFARSAIDTAHAKTDPLAAIRESLSAVTMTGAGTPALVKDVEVTREVHQYLTSSLWAVVARHHLQPPLFDVKSCKLFRPVIELSAAAIEALAREQDAKVAAAAEAVAARRQAIAAD